MPSLSMVKRHHSPRENEINLKPMIDAGFEKIYSNLPIPERSMPIYVDKEFGIMSWNVVYLEVKNNTELGLRALESLRLLKII